MAELPAEKPDQTPPPEEKKSDSLPREIDENKLTKEEVARLRREEVSTDELAAEREELKKTAEDELNTLVRQQKVIDLGEYRQYRQKLEDTESPDKTREILEEIRDIPQSKAEKAAAGDKELPPNSPEILKLQKQWDQICDQNAKYIGTNQIKGFKEYFRDESAKTPRLGHLNELISKLKGNIPDKNGLAPRIEEFRRIETIFRRYGISATESSFIKKEGLSERQNFRKAAESLAAHFDHQSDTGFYSQEMIRKTMTKLLREGTPSSLGEALSETKNVARQESEAFTHLDATITVGGRNIRKMSDASKNKFLEYYKGTDIKERARLVQNIRTLVENEAKLSRDIEKIYTDAGDPQGLNLALDSFEELDFLAKEKSLKEHKNLLKENENREEREKNLTIKAAHSKIDAAARKKTISAGGEGTQGKYKEFFNTPENFKNEQTQEPGDLQALKKAYEILISPQPQEQFKNLASYEKRRQDFQKDLKHLADANPNIDPDTIREWQERYDDTGWREREQIATMELPKEIEHQKSKYREAKESGITPDSQETKEGIKSRSELIVALNEYLAEDSEESVNRGLREIRLYFINNPEAENDRTLLYLEEQLAHRKRELGPTKQHAEPDNDRIMEEIDNVAENDTHIDDHLFEEQLRTLNLEGAKKNEQRHNKKTSAHERAMEESLNNAENGSIEKKLTRDAYDQMGDEYIINADKTGEELMEIKFSDEEISTQDRINLDSRTYDEQGKLANEQGFSHISMTDKTGHEISSSEAEKLQDKNLAHIEADMVARAEERTKTKGDTKILDLQSRIAASRHAREIIEQKRHERLVI